MMTVPSIRQITLAMLVILWPGVLNAAPNSLPPAPQQIIDMALEAELKPLSALDLRLYKRIFDEQSQGDWKKADRLIMQLENKILLGHVLYQRYMHPTAYQSRYSELSDWMLKYPDHPGAKRIYDLAKKKNGGKARNLHKPVPALALNFPADKPLRRPSPTETTEQEEPEETESPAPDTIDPHAAQPNARHNKADRVDIYNLKTRIKRYLNRRNPERAEKRLWAFERRNLLSEPEFGKLLSDIANGYFFDSQDAKALALGRIAAESGRDMVSQADWISGLSSWRLGDCSQAAFHFEKVATSAIAGDWTVAAGAFWAARSHLVCRQPDKVSKYLKIAASYQRTFYGLIAAHQLGQESDFNWADPAFSQSHYNRIKDMRSVQRAIALAQTNKIMLADMELSDTWRRTRGNKHDALLGLASKLGLAGTQLKIGKIEEQKQRTALDSTLYPIPDTAPEGGFTIDRSLMFAIMRQESEFNSWAKSHAGARGIMQVMPRTASYISQDRSLRFGSRIKLDDPRYNMALGQQYVQTMLGEDYANGNLFKTLTAYNAGPGNLRKWERKINYQDDPLLFIESIPARETRNYIEKVISNYWIYQLRMNQKPHSLDTIAIGKWPMYIAQDNNQKSRQKHASR